MSSQASEISLKPRILIADDSRIVRAVLIKHIEGMFDFREALDGIQAWEMLLIDPSIRVVISDLTMPKLDGYGLLQRIRASKISRIRNMPVVVVSGSDEQAERERAKAAGATDLITKGIGTAQLLSRLDILSKLESTQHEFERGLEVLVERGDHSHHAILPSEQEWQLQARGMHANALRQGKNFVVLHACIGLKHAGLEGYPVAPPPSIVSAIGQLLFRTVRQSDCVAQTGAAEFSVATGSIHFDSARNFAERVCRAISHANLIGASEMNLIASCGVVSVTECGEQTIDGDGLQQMCVIAHQRALLGLQHGVTGVIGQPEAELLAHGGMLEKLPQSVTANTALEAMHPLTMNMADLLQLIKDGKEEQVSAYFAQLSDQLRPLVTLLLRQVRS
jgi:CheY-like chemotaxis protein